MLVEDQLINQTRYDGVVFAFQSTPGYSGFSDFAWVIAKGEDKGSAFG